MPTHAQVDSLEDSISRATRKIGKWRDSKADLLAKCTDASCCTPSTVRRAERAVLHDETILVAALDELRDELTLVVVPAKIEAHYAKQAET